MMCRGVFGLGASSRVGASAGLLLGATVVLSTVSLGAMPAKAQYGSGQYTSEQFVAVLKGIGYPIASVSLEAYEVREAIASIQREANLPVTGRLDAYTEAYTASNVQLIQRQLNQIMGLNLPNNQPFYGPQTTQGITDFQRAYNLPVTGTADLTTRRYLQQVAGRVAIVPQKPIAQPPIGGDNALYTDAELRVILQGLGYDIDLNRSLRDRPAVMALLAFQREYNLDRTGVADYSTQRKLQTVLHQLQENLRRVVDRNLTVTGNYDAQTGAAVKTFQAREKLSINGIATLGVRQRLNTIAQGRA